jgi:hypothetical protein
MQAGNQEFNRSAQQQNPQNKRISKHNCQARDGDTYQLATEASFLEAWIFRSVANLKKGTSSEVKLQSGRAAGESFPSPSGAGGEG